MPAPRRAFLEPREPLPLLCDALLGRDAALRRILGARGAGRLGLLLAGAALLAAVPVRSLPLVLGAHALLTLATRPWLSILGWGEQQRLLLWLCAPPLAAAALARALGAPALALALLALALGHTLLVRHLRAWRAPPD